MGTLEVRSCPQWCQINPAWTLCANDGKVVGGGGGAGAGAGAGGSSRVSQREVRLGAGPERLS